MSVLDKDPGVCVGTGSLFKDRSDPSRIMLKSNFSSASFNYVIISFMLTLILEVKVKTSHFFFVLDPGSKWSHNPAINSVRCAAAVVK